METQQVQQGQQAQPQIPITNLDPTALTLSRAIRASETSLDGDYNKTITEPNGTTSWGAYMWNGDNFQNWAKQYGLDPNDKSPQNQDKLAYTRIKSLLDKGLSQSEIAAMWNGAHTSNGTLVANQPSYAEKVKSNYEKLAQNYGQPQSQFVDPSQIKLTPFQQTGTQQTGTQTPTTQPSQEPSGAGGVLKSAVPALFDALDLLQGRSKKTPLQLLGDLGLTASWFIPGFGEMGALGKLATNVGLGYGIGTLGNLASGQNIGQALTPQTTNIAGAAFGGVGSLATEALGGIIRKAADISPQIETALKSGSITKDDYLAYMNAAKAHATDVRTPTPLTMAADKLDEAASMIDKQTANAGKIIGDAKTGLSNVKLSDTSQIAEDFKNRALNDYGIQISPTGKVIPVKGRISPLSASDANRLASTYKDLVSLSGKNATARTATDLIGKIDSGINYAKAGSIQGFDPLQQMMLGTRSQVDNALRSVAPDLAKANDTYSVLKSVQQEINKMAGAEGQRGELLMRRVFSGDKSGQVQDLFNKIKQLTGIDLVDHAVLAKHAIQSIGDKSQNTLLEQIFGNIKQAQGGLIPLAMSKGTEAIKKIATPERIGLRMIEGKPEIGQGLLSKLVQRTARQSGGLLRGGQ